MAEAMTILSSSGFESALKGSKKLFVVEFVKDGCPACKEIAPVYREISQELSKLADFAIVNAPQNADLAAKYGIMATPTFVFLCSGRPIGSLVGAMNPTLLRNTIKDMARHKNECLSRSTPVVYEIDGY